MGIFEQIALKLGQGHIGRREFMRGAVSLGLTATAAGLLADKATAGAGRRGGTLRLGLGSGSTTDSLDPGTIDSPFNQVWSFGCLRNSLTQIAPDGSLAPELAESWEGARDARTWRMRLRRDVEFHNGKTMTTADVIASIDHHRGESTSAVRSLLDPVEQISADGDYVVVRLSAPNADFPYFLADQHLAIVPEVDGQADVYSGVGTGPYRLERYDPGVAATGTRFENHFDTNSGWFDAVEILAIHDVAARTNALTSGSIDYMDRCDLKTVRLLGQDPGLDILAVPGGQHYTFAMNTQLAPFDDGDVRLALKYAIDRKALVDKILSGYGSVGNDHPIGSNYRYHDGSLPQRQYDFDRAAFHLRRAGLSTLKVSLHVADAAFAGAVDAALLYREAARPAGIEIEVVREPNDGYWSNVWMIKPWSAVYWAGRPTEDLMFSLAYTPDAKWNDTSWSDDRFNALLAAGRSELDEKKRGEIYSEMQQIVSDQGGVVVPMFANFVSGHSTKLVQPSRVAANLDNDGGRICQRWWFA